MGVIRGDNGLRGMDDEQLVAQGYILPRAAN